MNSVSWTDRSGALWLLGGYGRAGTDAEGHLNDLWKYHTDANQWAWVKGASSPNHPGSYGTLGIATSTNTPGARTLAVSWTDPADAPWLFGGSGRDSMGGFGYLNDLWRGATETPRWQIIECILGRIPTGDGLDINTDGFIDAADLIHSLLEP
jgi:hypothetical protein